MTRPEILQTGPGPALDILVAEQVMGFEPQPFDPEWGEHMWQVPGGGYIDASDIPAYSEQLEAAFEVVERMKQPPFTCSFTLMTTPYISSVFPGYLAAFRHDLYPPFYFGVITDYGSKVVIEGTAPEAICKSALLAVLEQREDRKP